MIESTTEVLKQATEMELAAINNMLSVAGVSNDVSVQLNTKRAELEPIEQTEINEALTANSTLVTAIAARRAHEANRALRDIEIATVSHKTLRASIYSTLYQRKLKLEKKLQDETYA